MTYIFKIVLFLLLGFYAIQRIWNNFASKKRIRDIAKNIENDEYAEDLSEQLDVMVLKESNDNFEKIRGNLNASKPIIIKNFQILATKKLNENTYLYVTEGTYFESDGKKETSHILDLCFKLTIDEAEKNLKIYSELYSSLTDKNLRYDFAKNLILSLKN